MPAKAERLAPAAAAVSSDWAEQYTAFTDPVAAALAAPLPAPEDAAVIRALLPAALAAAPAA